MVASFSSAPDGEIYGRFEGCFVPCDDNTGRGFLQTPSNGSRDLIDPYFTMVNGVEHCYVQSYLYRDEAALENYAGQTFEELPKSGYNSVYRLTERLEKLPALPEGRRLIVLNKDMEVRLRQPESEGEQAISRYPKAISALSNKVYKKLSILYGSGVFYSACTADFAHKSFWKK